MKIAPFLLLAVWGTASLFAGPVRPIPASQFSQPAPAPNGPPPDPTAQRGQWFVSVTNGLESARKWELHDTDDSLCIHGTVVAIQWGIGVSGGYTNIAGFTVLATVVNNLTPASLMAGPSTNSHSEIQSPPQPLYWGTMLRTRLAAEFAVAAAGPAAPPMVGIAPKVTGMTPPYYLDPGSAGQYVIEAQNEDLAAWYCFQMSDPNNPANPPGAYYVPAWEFGDIPPGASAQVEMQFQIKGYGGTPAEMPFSDLRHGVLRHSFLNGSDVFYNRSESLKISHWIDLILVDIGGAAVSIPYPGQEPVEYIYASDVSVFFDSAGDINRPALNLTPLFNNQTLSGIRLDWMAQDVGPYVLQYCDNLALNNWSSMPLSVPMPPVIPGPMQWMDNGTVILPALPSSRYYRLFLP